MKTTLMTHRKGLYRSKSTFSFMFYSFIGMDIEVIIAFYDDTWTKTVTF
jgi:hypothetical protein